MRKNYQEGLEKLNNNSFESKKLKTNSKSLLTGLLYYSILHHIIIYPIIHPITLIAYTIEF